MMQTFLPYADFRKSAKVLDRQRLGKQRVEVYQILKALHGQGGWQNHPATKMWAGYENALAIYGITMCMEWIDRGYKDNLTSVLYDYYQYSEHYGFPWWFGNESFHLSHQSNLLRKMPEHYGPIFGDIPNDLPYIWPTKDLTLATTD